MATITQQIDISKKSQEAIISYAAEMQQRHSGTYNITDKLLRKDQAYMREVDFSVDKWKAEVVKRRGDITKFHNVVIPVVLPQVEAAVAFQTEMFLSGFPIFGVVAEPEHIDAALMMDTIIGTQQTRGNWVLEYQKAFRDGFKYNIMATLVDWNRERTFAVANRDDTVDSQLTELIWEGNIVKRMDLYNTFWDPSVVPAAISKDGEYVGYKELYTKIRLQRWLLSQPGVVNSKEAMESRLAGTANSNSPTGYYFPEINPEALIHPDTLGTTYWNTFWTGQAPHNTVNTALYSNRYQLTTVFVRIVPSEFGIRKVPAPDVPQIWKFCIVNNKILVLAERLTNAHDQLPIVFAQPYDDGLGYQTKSLTDNVMPMQEITTALANSTIQSRRRAISDRALFDPLRINSADINNPSPTAKIPAKPGAFGGRLEDAYRAIPFVDDQFQVNSADMQAYFNLADTVTGMNQARQGQFTKGNRTRAEFTEIMQFGDKRDRTISQAIECGLFMPTKEILKANILQYQTGVKLFNPEREEAVVVDPLELRKAMLVFKLSDGLLPSERILDGEALTIAMQTIQAVPQLATGYNIVPMFSYILKSRGAKLAPFEKSPEQLAYEQAVQQWQQTMLGMAQQISQNKEITPEMLQEAAQQLPPQPKPADFGYDPTVPVQATSDKSVLEMVIEADQQGAGVSEGGPETV